MDDGDVRLTDEELRIIGEIERRAGSRWPTRRVQLRRWVCGRRGGGRLGRRAAVAWSLILLGMIVMLTGLVVGRPEIGLAGFAVLTLAIADRCRQVTPVSVILRVRRFLRLTGQPEH